MIIFIKTLSCASPVLNACFICVILFNHDYKSTRKVALALFVIWKQNESKWIGQSLKDKNSKIYFYWDFFFSHHLLLLTINLVVVFSNICLFLLFNFSLMHLECLRLKFPSNFCLNSISKFWYEVLSLFSSKLSF